MIALAAGEPAGIGLVADWCLCMLQAAIHSVVAGGRVVTVGMGCDHAHLPVSTINCKEIDLMGSFRYANTVSPAFLLNWLCQHPVSRLSIGIFKIWCL